MYKIIVEKNRLSLRDWKEEVLTTGLVGEKIAFEFGIEWSGLIKTAVFKDDTELLTDVTIGSDNIVTIPAEALRTPGSKLYVGVYGETEDGSVVIPTCYTTLGNVSQGAEKTDRPAKPPAPDWTARVDRQLQLTAEMTEEMQRKADAAEVHATAAKSEADRAKSEADRAEFTTDSKANKNEVSNAIKISLSGAAVTTDMVSLIEHDIDCKISGANDLTAVTVTRCGANVLPEELNVLSGFNKGILPQSSGGPKGYIMHAGIKYILQCSKSASGLYIGKYEGGGDYAKTYNNTKLEYTPDTDKVVYAYCFFSDGASDVDVWISTGIAKPYESYNGTEYIPGSDGKVSGMASLGPSMTILTNTPGVTIEATYNADTKKYIDSKIAQLQQALINNI